MSSLIPLAGPLACAALMGGMMWMMMRGMGRGSASAASNADSTNDQLARLREENQQLRDQTGSHRTDRQAGVMPLNRSDFETTP